MTRGAVVTAANEATRLARRPGPQLTEQSGLETLRAWLMWCDPNGVWNDADRGREDIDPLTVDDAWAEIEVMLAS